MSDELRDFLQRVDSERPKIVVRWADEQRILPAEADGFTVKRLVYATITALAEGEPMHHRIEGLTLQSIQAVVAEFPLDALYRSDNITR